MESSFHDKKSRWIRIWHWSNALAIAGLVGTGGLRKTYLSWRTTSAIIEAKMLDAGAPVSPELAKEIAVAIRTPMWENHYVFGIAMAVLLVARVVIAFVPGQSTTLKDLQRAVRERDVHAILVKALYVAFYGVAAYMATSGLLMYFRTELGLSQELVGSLKSLHELLLPVIAGFVGLHIAGVFVAELRGERGLVSRMIHGGEE